MLLEEGVEVGQQGSPAEPIVLAHRVARERLEVHTVDKRRGRSRARRMCRDPTRELDGHTLPWVRVVWAGRRVRELGYSDLYSASHAGRTLRW